MGENVLPRLRGIWDGQWEDHWWVKPLQTRRQVSPLRKPAAANGRVTEPAGVR
jgi:hypothetical protein